MKVRTYYNKLCLDDVLEIIALESETALEISQRRVPTCDIYHFDICDFLVYQTISKLNKMTIHTAWLNDVCDFGK